MSRTSKKLFIYAGLLVLLLISGDRVVYAQAPGRIAGRVVEHDGETPLASVSVVIVGTPLGTLTDERGDYVIEAVPEGTYIVRALRVGTTPGSASDVRVRAGTTTTVSFQLREEPIRGAQIVVTAARREQTALRTSATVEVIAGGQMRARGMRSLDQALETLPGVTLNRSSGAAVNAVQIRGTSDVRGGGVGNRALLLIDGRPAISPDTGGAFWNLLSTGIVERVEVVKGAFSALYGSNAMGGVIHVITKSPTDVDKTRVRLRYGIYDRPPAWMRITEHRSALSTVEISRSVPVGNGGFFFLLGRDASDGYRQNADYTRLNFYGKWTHRFQPDRLLSVAAGRNVLDRGYPHSWNSILHPLEVLPEHRNDRQKKQDWNVDVALATPEISGKLYFYENYSESAMNPDGRTHDGFPPGYRVTSTANRLGSIIQMDRQAAEGHQVIVGMDASTDWVDAQPEDVSYGRHRVHSTAGFVQDEIELGSKGKVTLGVRYDYRKEGDRPSKGQWSPKVGGNWKIFEPTMLRCSIGRAFRDPSLAEMYIKREMGGGIRFDPSPGLRAETLTSAEIGLKHRIRDVAVLDVAVFWIALSDMIFWQKLEEGTYKAVNLGKARMQGAEFSFHTRRWKGFRSALTYSYLNAQDRTQGREEQADLSMQNDTLPYKPKHTLHFAVDYRLGPWHMQGDCRYVSEIAEVVFYPLDAPDAFRVVDLTTSYKPSDWITLRFQIRNAWNEQYEEMARYRMPGRSYIMEWVMERSKAGKEGAAPRPLAPDPW
jgi:outer membrane receptor protein involved in Fe transport